MSESLRDRVGSKIKRLILDNGGRSGQAAATLEANPNLDALEADLTELTSAGDDRVEELAQKYLVM
ncbi:hypothetical protein G4X40_14340 [Rhodococcus sp. D2-41]|uniref:Uncharacterized protein n=1 Tax=Speluncibacter jeojiensis TaxID=2710754 RepID=A0A9X4RFU5_9ACTN|nr:hypothetical protein [Rhodococcus sp. D2-41]MDG3011331.1 hypothetical protein [Rhodococcus sp. D2-41]MDG3016657.1 hypothetical protein [Corynebacteriales bacterium D3-21]